MDVGLSRNTSPTVVPCSWGSCASLPNPLVLSAELGCLLSGTMGTFHLPWMHVPCTQCGHSQNMESFTIYGLGWELLSVEKEWNPIKLERGSRALPLGTCFPEPPLSCDV